MIEIAHKSTEIQANWQAAVLYCQFLEHNGYNNWRLPTLDELQEIYNTRTDFTDFTDRCYWSLDEYHTGNDAWCQGMKLGGHYADDKDSINHVRPVRDV